MKRYTLLNPHEIAKSERKALFYNEWIILFEDAAPMLRSNLTDYRINCFTFLFVQKGEASLCVNGKMLFLTENTLLLLSPIHVVNTSSLSPTIVIKGVFIDRDFFNRVPYSDNLYKFVRLYNSPTISMNKMEGEAILQSIDAIYNKLELYNHLFKKEIILIFLANFLLELTNILNKIDTTNISIITKKRDEVFRGFIELLLQHFRLEHKVLFYAKTLNMSTQNLTLIVKETTGKTVNDFINEMLYCEAINLLSQSKMSIQEISESLNFSDQSSFGKFFKRMEGISPLNYKNSIG